MHPCWYCRLSFFTKLRKCNVFTSVWQEFCPQGEGRYTPPWQTSPPRQTPPWTDTTLPLGRHHPPPGQTATAADDTHPTGIHSCFAVWSITPNRNYYINDDTDFAQSWSCPFHTNSNTAVYNFHQISWSWYSLFISNIKGLWKDTACFPYATVIKVHQNIKFGAFLIP